MRLALSQVIWFAHVAWLILTSLFVAPWFILRRPSTFVLSRGRNFIDHLINFNLDYSSRVQALELPALRALLNGPPPCLELLFESGFGNVNFFEALILGYIVQAHRSKRIFEIGTFDGYSTYHLIKNAPPDARVFTLNLPVESELAEYESIYDLVVYHGDAVTHNQLISRGVGAFFRSSDAADRVTQLFGDSMTYDFSPYRQSIDLCFVDGGHTRAHAESDTRQALEMVVPGGIIIWHDYNRQHRCIYGFINELADRYKIFRVKGTRFALLVKPAG